MKKPLSKPGSGMTRSMVSRVACVLICWCGCASAVDTTGVASVDAILAEAHRDANVEPAVLTDDRIFLRRITLDLVGRVPTIDEVEAFRRTGDRRQRVEALLASEEFDQYWSQLWTSILIGRNAQDQSDREALRQWLEDAFRSRAPFDQVAFDLISAQGVTSLHGPVNFLVGNREDPVTSVSRVFLGVQLDCARCHDHPYDRWTEEDYTLMRRFFQTVRFVEVSGGIELDDEARSSRDQKDLPRFLTGARPRTAAWRREMALMTVRSKPFARAIGNRTWQLLFGRGMVNPVDGLSENDRPSVPKLHQALADQLRAQHFDLRQLIRTICLSDAYQRQSIEADPQDASARESLHLFASREVRPLLPEQLVRSFSTIIGGDEMSPEQWNERSIGLLGRSAAATGSSDPLRALRTSQGLLTELAVEVTTPRGDLDALFLSTLSRRPNQWERERLGDVNRRDVLYSLLHCNEFVFCQ